jgi:hypothetical protein
MVDELEIENRLTRAEERSKSNTHRIDKLEPIVNEIHKMSETLVVMASELKATNANVKEINDKVDELEREPAKKWKDSTKALFNAFLGAMGTAITTGVIYLLTQIH